MKNAISQDDVDVHYFLCSGKSFSQHERDNLATGFTTREETTVREKTQNEKKQRFKEQKYIMAHSIHTISIKKHLKMNWLVCP